MQLDKLSVNVRPIPPDQAIDLGLAMARAWYGSLFWLWFSRTMTLCIFVFTLCSCLTAVLNWSSEFFFCFALFLFYMLSGYVDGFLIALLGKKLFNFDGNFNEEFKDELDRHSFVGIFFRSIGIKRPITLSVYLLEGATKKEAKARTAVLTRGCWMVLLRYRLAFLAVRWLLFFGIYFSTVFLFSDMDISDLVQFWLLIGVFFLGVLVIGLVAPFFVASGFAIYLCQRSLLEAWDIELIFRKMAIRFAQAHQKGGGNE